MPRSQGRRYSAAANKDAIEITAKVYVASEDQLIKAAAGVGSALRSAKKAYNAGGTAKGLSHAGDALMDVASAQARLGLAAAASAGTTVIAATANVGTGIGQILNWGWTSIFGTMEPDIGSGDPGYEYNPPDPDEVDEALKKALKKAKAPETLTSRDDFLDVDATIEGAGTACWEFLYTGMRGLMIALRTMAAPGATHAENQDLNESIAAFNHAANMFAPYLARSKSHVEDPSREIEAARASLHQFDASAHECNDPAAVHAAVAEGLDALAAAEAALENLRDKSGNLRPLEGPNGWIPPLTLDEFEGFIRACTEKGAAALPEFEVEILEELIANEGLQVLGHKSAGDLVAAYVAEGDTGNEAALFGRSGELAVSAAIHTTEAGSAATQRTEAGSAAVHMTEAGSAPTQRTDPGSEQRRFRR